MYIGRNERCKIIREELKKNGINTKMVSVTGKSCGYSDSITVKIKDLKINKKLVDEIAIKQKEVSYCQVSGEILEGCNTYVFIDFDYDALKKETEKFLNLAKKTIEKNINLKENHGERIVNFKNYEIIYFRKTSNSWGFIELFDKKNNICIRETRYAAYNEYTLAESLAILCNQYLIEINL